MSELIETPGVRGIIAPIHIAPMTPEEAAKGKSTVTMIFDVKVRLTLQTNEVVDYPAGVHEVPENLVNHWYLRAHGVRRYAKPVSFAEEIMAPAAPVKGKAGKR